MQQIIFATENDFKLAEVKAFAQQRNLQLVGARALRLETAVRETGTTFEENALLKMNNILEQINDPNVWVLGDDSGVAIDALNGEPGIRSRRWNGSEMTQKEIVQYTLLKMRHIPYEKRTAQMISVVALGRLGIPPRIFTGTLHGFILEGLADPDLPNATVFGRLFYVPTEKATLAELERNTERPRTHRKFAFEQALTYIEQSPLEGRAGFFDPRSYKQ